jgi:uncharacterized protein YbjT (DUF2867 family)
LITVTGSTGTIGRELVRLLAAAGADTRAVYRDADKGQSLPPVTRVQADLRDPRQLAGALAGSTRLFLLTGNDPDFWRVQTAIVEAAERLGVRHLVKLSALGASDHSRSAIGREHWAVEQAIQRTRIPWTMLRPHAFMQNWLGDVAASVRTEGVIYAPIGDGRVPFIDTRDIAAVAAEVLLHPEAHVGKKYVLTGGAAVGYADVAAALSEVLGRTVTYRPITMEDARARLAARGTAAALIDATLAIASYQKEGGATAVVSPSVQQLLGRPPLTIREFVRDYADRFGR